MRVLSEVDARPRSLGGIGPASGAPELMNCITGRPNASLRAKMARPDFATVRMRMIDPPLIREPDVRAVVEPSTLARAFGWVEAERPVRRDADEHDGRATGVRVTGKARAAFARHRLHTAGAHALVLHRIPEGGRQGLLSTLRDVPAPTRKHAL